MSTWLKLSPAEMVWLVRPVDGAAVPPRDKTPSTAMTAAFDAALDQLAEQHSRLLAARARAARMKARSVELAARVSELEADNARLRGALAPALKLRRTAFDLRGRFRRA